jgi:putative spermidine/putrescine transport system permease protein
LPSDSETASPSLLHRISTGLYVRPKLLLVLLLVPPLLWLGVIYLGSLFSMLVQSFFAVDDFTGKVVYQPTLASYAGLFNETSLGVIRRTVLTAAIVTLICASIAFPLAYYMARYAGQRAKAVFYVAVMLPLWSNYLVRVYAWKLILAKEGAITWLLAHLGLSAPLDWILSTDIGGASLGTSQIGTTIVFVYIWLPYMVLPIQAALERVPKSLIEASSDLGARPRETFRRVILPLSIPGVAAGSIFTFSLTLGDYIIPNLVGSSRPFIGQLVYQYQGTASNLPLAAAFAVVPIVIMAVYLSLVKRLGAFDAL